MEFKQIQELLKTVNKSNISEVTIKDGEFEITIKQQGYPTEGQYIAAPIYQQAPIAATAPVQAVPAPAAAPAAAPVENSNAITIKSPMIGTFYRAAGPEKPVFASVGDEIKVGQVLCIVEAMKLFNEIESEVSGRIIKVLVDDASPVEYDQPLFLVEPI